MSSQSEAEENLRVIRSLMERATIYRAIAAPTALLGGALSAGLAAWLLSTGELASHRPASVSLMWLAVAVFTAAANTIFLWQDARRRGDAFVSAGMRLAVKALAPSFIVASVLTAGLLTTPDFACVAWSLCYGLALLSTAHFAPRSMAGLGWAFLIAGLLVLIVMPSRLWAAGDFAIGERLSFANGFMGATFGLFHLVYAACTWPRSAPARVAAGKA